jgi:hypothetical protein
VKSSFLTLFILLSVASAQEDAFQQLFKEGNDSYADSSWSEAIAKFDSILTNGFHHCNLYYNLGNAFYQSEMFGHAIWAYEKGLQIDPDDDDLHHNLIFVKREAGISELPKPVFLIRFYNSVKSSYQPHQWLLISSMAFLISGLLFTFSHLGSVGMARIMKAPFVMMIVVIILSGLIYLDVQKDVSSMKSGIIVAHVSVGAKSAPDEGAKTLLKLPEGMKVNITGEQIDWREVESIDGSKGWVKSEDVRSLVW